LAFDVGMMLLERRDQQNAADAAALAGARYVLTSGNFAGPCTGAGGNEAATAACNLAVSNGFVDAEAFEDVTVNIPPIQGIYEGLPGFVQVTINSTRASIFGGVIGKAAWPVGTFAVAGNQPGIEVSFGMLALSPDGCKAMQVACTGAIYSAASVYSNSDGSACTDGEAVGFSRTGGGTIDLDVDSVCASLVEIQNKGAGELDCAQQVPAPRLPDPLRFLAAPAKPTTLPAALIPVGHSDVPPGNCPGTNDTVKPFKPFEETQTSSCIIDKAWIFEPGLYPAGIEVKGPNAVAYLLPGIYWIGGGGFRTTVDGSVISVAAGSTTTSLATCQANRSACAPAGGIMLYNSKLPTKADGPISLGGGGATVKLLPYLYPFGDPAVTTDDLDLVIFQDRTVCQDVTLNGSDSSANSIRGIVYVPCGQVKVNGAASVFTLDQIIAETFYISGNNGTVNVLRESGINAEIAGVGLVE